MENTNPSKLGFYAKEGLRVFLGKKATRTTEVVAAEYDSWNDYRQTLDQAQAVDEWMVAGLDHGKGWYIVDGKLSYTTFNSAEYYRQTLRKLLAQHFPAAQSVVEFGCGVGRNLIFLKALFPRIRCYGYELVPGAVEIANTAARKFDFDIQYAQLDYLNDGDEKLVFPVADVAFTMFSLEQLPRRCDFALARIMSRCAHGSIHLEPVSERYPLSLLGLIARGQHANANYLTGFRKAVAQQELADVVSFNLSGSHSPVMFPSAYVLKK
jgi:SAM-dependent methyltransferase